MYKESHIQMSFSSKIDKKGVIKNNYESLTTIRDIKLREREGKKQCCVGVWPVSRPCLLVVHCALQKSLFHRKGVQRGYISRVKTPEKSEWSMFELERSTMFSSDFTNDS